MQLYHYFRSSASYRVRIALALKGLPAELLPVHLVRNEQLAPGYSARAPSQLVPLLVEDDGHTVGQSMAIIEYLDEIHPEPRLLPGSARDRARIRTIAQDIGCEIHPLDNLRVLRYLVKEMGVSDAQKDSWYRHWVEQGLAVVEQRLAAPETGRFCHGDTPTLADCVLVPQIFNARRLDCKIDQFTRVMAVFEHCMALEAFSSTQPSAYPEAADAPR